MFTLSGDFACFLMQFLCDFLCFCAMIQSLSLCAVISLQYEHNKFSIALRSRCFFTVLVPDFSSFSCVFKYVFMCCEIIMSPLSEDFVGFLI